jgi:hypothetical protein
MTCQNQNPFDRIDAALEYLTLLSQTVQENRQKVQTEIMVVTHQPRRRQFEALSLVAYNLEKLEQHLKASRKALNDLRKLRMLLINEEVQKTVDPAEADGTPFVEALSGVSF